MNQFTKSAPRWVRYAIIFVTAAAGTAVYLLMAEIEGGLGFPLDDAWIHQTYARNLAQNGRLAFIADEASAGSTSPLWTLMLAVGYLLHLPYLWWTYFLGAASLFWLSWNGMHLWRQLWPQWAQKEWAVGLILMFTWPFLWAAASGMETLFFVALGLKLLSVYLTVAKSSRRKIKKVVWLGLLAGLLILTRPDGLVLVVLVGLGLLLSFKSWKERWRWGAAYLGTVGILLLPYFAFNLWTSGTIWPNTLYAKQTEYAALLTVPIVNRFFQLAYFSLGGPSSGWQGMSGPQLLLLPGVIVASWQTLRHDWMARRLWQSVPLLWAGGHLFLYAWRLPLVFQHGRYLLAAYPIWILLGLGGWQWLLFSRSGTRYLWITQQVAKWTFVGLLLIFVGLGSKAYADDVAFIEGEMVTMAKWIAQNTPKTALIASHDIGAIGYFAERPLLDLAGLISPEVIPLLNDEQLLGQYLLNSEAEYLVTAPGWSYQAVIEKAQIRPLFTTNYDWTVENGQNNMTIYLLKGY